MKLSGILTMMFSKPDPVKVGQEIRLPNKETDWQAVVSVQFPDAVES